MTTLLIGTMLLATVIVLCFQQMFGAQYKNIHETSQTVEGTVEVCRWMTTTPNTCMQHAHGVAVSLPQRGGSRGGGMGIN